MLQRARQFLAVNPDRLLLVGGEEFLNPLRDGSNFGSRTGAIVKCPLDPVSNKPRLPAPDKHCDSVPGSTLSGGNAF